ncbi:PglZ domain-containing protein [uncultured Cocleimonas sp.]|uniref:PglZ domain-containing protein n=1 Tax=uncultured Cocleimonas sp. TaxID=1051587 RepID=UPI00262F28B3|nr:PglZ domain-containing protein [uncultured Cocleimonas sp.]
MSIEQYISTQVFEKRLNKRVLVVYDYAHRYRDICLSMASEVVFVVDTSESSIESRELALETLISFGEGGQKLLIYVPVAKPVTDEDQQKDPFSIYSACGEVFPDGDGDRYLSLCLKAKPDHQTEVRNAFDQDPNPSFAVINGIGGGLQWPTLRALLNVESSPEIVSALMVPDAAQKKELDSNEAWVAEAKQLFEQVLGLTLTTRGKKWKSVSEELWRYVLFSEFVFDLPGELPACLAGVPRANSTAKPIIESLCDGLRQDLRKQEDYIKYAEQIEHPNDLNLEQVCRSVDDLGIRDTFPFEERTFLQVAIKAIKDNELEALNEILSQRKVSIWSNRGENETQWDLVAAAKRLIESCNDLLRELPEHSASQATLLDYYLTSLREADRLQREFEQAVTDYWDALGLLTPVIDKARREYRKLAEKVQILFTKQLAETGWPPQGRLYNADVFDEIVAPKLQTSGQRVAYLMVDALRFELGLELEKQLKDEFEITLKPAYACLPSITLIGMASLLPGAGKDLSIIKGDSGMIPMLGDIPVSTVPQRMKIFEKRFGSRFAEMRADDFIDNNHKFDKSVELAVLRSVEIDTQFENTPKTAPSVILRELKNIRVAISMLQNQGFNQIVIATDHGFFMNRQATDGDVCPKPAGDWYLTHERIALGSGNADHHHFIMPAPQAGIKGDYSHLAGPSTMAAYSKGKLYFHGGASLQECVVPVMEVKLKGRTKVVQQSKVSLNYKNGTKVITSRRPVIELFVTSDDMFAQTEILLEAHNDSGEVIGEAKIGGAVNAATRTVSLQTGDSQKVTIIMDDDFEGVFTIKALNPNTLAEFAQVKLKTKYMDM